MFEAEKWYTEGESTKCLLPSFRMASPARMCWEIAPEGWSQSTLRFVFHPTVDQVYFEAVKMHKNVNDLFRRETGNYMGTFTIAQRADLTPVYEMIFRRLKERLFDWQYRFPELGLVDSGSDKPDGARSLQVEQMKTELKKTHRDAIDDAKHDPIPTIVLAYESVYGHLPHGWPPWKFQDRSE
jgi:hypothetical protein